MNLSGPEKLACGTVEAKNALGLLLFVRGRENHSITDHDGRAMSASGNFRLPEDVLRVAPFERQVLSLGGHSVLPRPAPEGPIG